MKISVKWLGISATALAWVGLGVLLATQEAGNKYSQAAANRIVSLAPNLTEILFALGLESRIAAVSSDSDYPPEADTKLKLGNFWQPNLEAVIAARPDLVVTLWFEQQSGIARRLERIGYRSLTLKIESITELFAAIEKIGEATGQKDESARLVGRIQQQFTDIQNRLGSTRPYKVLWVVQTEPLRVAGPDTFVSELIKLAGGENAIGKTIHKYPPIGAEQLIACAPDVIIQPAMQAGDLERQQRAAQVFWSRWENVPAVRNNRIYVLQADTVSRLGPRLAQGVRMVARCLHPEFFRRTRMTRELVVGK